jgi:hypothetical protein
MLRIEETKSRGLVVTTRAFRAKTVSSDRNSFCLQFGSGVRRYVSFEVVRVTTLVRAECAVNVCHLAFGWDVSDRAGGWKG